jgi:hypothetical protein
MCCTELVADILLSSVAAKLRSREFDEGLEMYERDAGSALDELD